MHDAQPQMMHHSAVELVVSVVDVQQGEQVLHVDVYKRQDKLRKATGSRKWALIRGCPNGETRQSNTLSTCTEYIGVRGEPPELKHLSRARKRNQPRFR